MKNVKLNLGSGKDYDTNFINIDISNSNKVDIRADLGKRFPFENNYASEIKASDILEHFTKEEGEIFLSECFRVLKPEGKILLRTHNIFQIFKQFSSDPQVLIHFIYGDTSEGIPGSHKYAYTQDSISKLLKKIGFQIESIKEIQTNFEVIAIKSKTLSKELKIGVIMQSPDIGGAETFMASLIKEFSKENKVFSVSNSSEFLSLVSKDSKTRKVNLTMDIIGNYRGLLKTFLLLPYAFYSYFNILRWFKKEKVNVILMSNFTEKLFVTLFSTLFSFPTVWIEYGKMDSVLKRNFSIPKIIYIIASKIPYSIIVPTEFTKNSLIREHISLSKIRTIPLGVEVPKNFSRKTSKDTFIIGSVSRLAKEKGQEYLIKAMPQILKSIPNTKLLLVGRGPAEGYFKTLAKELGIEKNVEFTGFVDNLDKEYSKMNVFVFPTVWDMEGFGLVLPEAMLRKIPVVASEMEPITAIVQDEKNALLFKSGNPSDLAKKVIRLYKNPGLAKKLSDESYKLALKNYTINTSSAKIKNILYEATIR